MTTPARRQYLRIKSQYPDAILMYQVGDFYETFDEDARIAARELQIVLTSRKDGEDGRVPLAGVPLHALENYVGKLVQRGYKVAICDQVGEVGKGIVERAVTRILTAGTLSEPNLLPTRKNNYLVALLPHARRLASLLSMSAPANLSSPGSLPLNCPLPSRRNCSVSPPLNALLSRGANPIAINFPPRR